MVMGPCLDEGVIWEELAPNHSLVNGKEYLFVESDEAFPSISSSAVNNSTVTNITSAQDEIKAKYEKVPKRSVNMIYSTNFSFANATKRQQAAAAITTIASEKTKLPSVDVVQSSSITSSPPLGDESSSVLKAVPVVGDDTKQKKMKKTS